MILDGLAPLMGVGCDSRGICAADWGELGNIHAD